MTQLIRTLSQLAVGRTLPLDLIELFLMLAMPCVIAAEYNRDEICR